MRISGTLGDWRPRGPTPAARPAPAGGHGGGEQFDEQEFHRWRLARRALGRDAAERRSRAPGAPMARSRTAAPRTWILRSRRLGRRSTKARGAGRRRWSAAGCCSKLAGLIHEHAPGARRARGARHRQAADVGEERHRRARTLLRVLRRRRRQVARRDHSLPERLPRRAPARAARRHRTHPAVELSGADVRPHAGAVAGGRQRRGAQARRGRLRFVVARWGSSWPMPASLRAR